MSNEEFPSFQKAPQSQKSENKWTSFLFVAGALGVTALLIVLGFRFLVGAKTLREEMLPKILSASPGRQSSLLMEWMQNLDQSAISKNWTPNQAEQAELLRFSAARINELKQEGTSPALYALHVAGWGPGLTESKEVTELRTASLSEESNLALALYFLRQKDFSAETVAFMEKEAQSAKEAARKVGGAYFTHCVAVRGADSEPCRKQMLQLLGDSVDEVRWNVALGILRERKSEGAFLNAEIEKAADEIGKLYVLIRNGDPTVLSRFKGAALESLATEVFTVKYELNPSEMKQELEQISQNHSDLRIRNVARSLESKFQEK